MIILAIETSCDETAAAILKGDRDELQILSNVVSSQIKLHSRWGGVVPNLAAREHLKNILPVLEESFQKANLRPDDIDLIATTKGPGLIPALLIGNNTAKTLSYVWKKPLIGIHHIEGHIYANFLSEEGKEKKKINFPLLCLVVSGGHTQLVKMENHLSYEIIGETLDDAAGEAFDKVARILGLGYPGGPQIAKAAEKFSAKNQAYKFLKEPLPRPMLKSKDLNFSFSGLKTAVLYLVKKNEIHQKKASFIQEVAYEFQRAAIDVLVQKTLLAAEKYQPRTISIAGGVSANQELRRQLGEAITQKMPKINYLVPPLQYSLDNAAMIAAAAYYRWKAEKNRAKFKNSWAQLSSEANLKLK